MLVTKSPLRLSFFGGSSDLPSFFKQKPGLCVSTTIDNFVYLSVNRCSAKHLKVIYSKMELTKDVEEIQNSRVREALKYFEIYSNIEICNFTSSGSTKGSGLGASSSFLVGLVSALYFLKYGKQASKKELAEIACYIEIDRCKEKIGLQDQYASAYGGFNSYRFLSEEVRIEPVKIHPQTLRDLEKHLLFFNTNITRSTSAILERQVENISHGSSVDSVSSLVDMAEESLKLFQNGHTNLKEFGNLLHEAWKVKRSLSGTSNEIIDSMYDTAREGGALGGKILGAGGGGYLMIFAPHSKKEKILKAMKQYERHDFKFYPEGSSLIQI